MLIPPHSFLRCEISREHRLIFMSEVLGVREAAVTEEAWDKTMAKRAEGQLKSIDGLTPKMQQIEVIGENVKISQALSRAHRYAESRLASGSAGSNPGCLDLIP